MLEKCSIPFLQIEPTTRCNYRCGFCAGRSLPQQDMTMETFRAVFTAFSGTRYIELQGEGEPFFSAHFFDMLEYAQAVRPKLSVSLITNGTFLTPDNSARILRSNTEKIQVGRESGQDILSRRQELLERLQAGVIPENCQGCNVAGSAVARRGNVFRRARCE